MPALLYAHGRPGLYFRVLEEGEIGAGDAIERIAVGQGAMTVREISALLYLPGQTVRALERAIASASNVSPKVRSASTCTTRCSPVM